MFICNCQFIFYRTFYVFIQHGTCPICRQSLAGEVSAPAAAVGGTEPAVDRVKPSSCSGSDDGSIEPYSCHSSPEDYSLLVDQQAAARTATTKTTNGSGRLAPDWLHSSTNRRADDKDTKPVQNSDNQDWLEEFLEDAEDGDIGTGRSAPDWLRSSTNRRADDKNMLSVQNNVGKDWLEGFMEEDRDNVGVVRNGGGERGGSGEATMDDSRRRKLNIYETLGDLSSGEEDGGDRRLNHSPGPYRNWRSGLNARSDRFQAWDQPVDMSAVAESSVKTHSKNTGGRSKLPNVLGASSTSAAARSHRIEPLSSTSSSGESADEEKDDGKKEEKRK